MADIQEYSVSIKFKTEGTDKAAKDTDKVKDSLGKLKSSTKSFDGLKSGFQSFTKGFGKAASVVKGVTLAIGAGMIKAGKSAYKYSQSMSDYIETVNLFKASMGDLADEAMDFVNMGEIKLGLNPQEMMDAISSFQNLSEGFGIASDRAYIMSKNMTQLAGDLSSFGNISFKEAQQKLMSGFSGQVMPLRKYGIALDQASLQELAYSLGLEQKVKNMTRAQKTELIYYQIMKSTQKMQGDLGRTLMSPANALRVMQNEFKSLARAVGSIFIPVIQTVIPYVRALTKVLTQAAQAIASFFGFNIADYTADLSGMSDGLGDIGGDIEDVGDAAEGTAKKMNKMLMPFDELNNITSNSGSGSGSGAGGGVGGSLGLDLPEYDMFANIDDRVLKFGDVLEKFKETAHKINELLRGIDWEQIKSTAGEIGTSLAEFLNVGLYEIDWNLVGRTVGEGLNTIIETIHSFVTTLDWQQLGLDIADTLNGFVSNADWAKTAQTVSASIKGVLETATTALEEFDWWNFAESIEEYFKNIDWGGIVSQLFEGLGAALGGLAVFLGKLLADVIEDIGKYFSDEIEKTGGSIAAGIFQGIADAFTNVGSWIADNIFMPFIEGFKKAFGIHSPSTEMAKMGGYIIEGLANGISEGLKNITEIWERIKTTLEEKTEEIKKGIVDIFSGLWGAILRGSQDAINWIIDGLNKVIEGINKAGKYLGIHLDDITHVTWADDYDKKMERMKNSTNNTMNKINESIKGTMNNLVPTVQGPLNIINEDFSQTFGNISKNTNDNLADVQKVAEEKSNKMEYAISSAFSKIEETANSSTQAIKIETEANLSAIANSSILSKLKNSIISAFDNAQEARQKGQQTGSGYSEAVEQAARASAIKESVKNSIKGMFVSYGEAYNWGGDMMYGFRNGIDANKQLVINKLKEMAESIKRLLHFSRPDEGPLRDYETWMPDMIKGLSDSLISATPILDKTLIKVANMIAESLGNIELPDVNNSIFANQSSTSIIGNIQSRMANTNQDEVTTNMIRATYEAVSKALGDNKQTDKQQLIQVNVGNKELYRGYGQFKDEQSNMLGVTV